jgi:nucleoside-diphosphate-sugar epimerase
MAKRSILVTGCAGFIGSNFTKIFRLQFPAVEIVGIDDLSAGRKNALTPGVVFYKGSITTGKLLDTIFEKHAPEYIFHFAALPRVSYSVEQPAETTETNIGGTVMLLEKARDYKIKRFILSSSSAIYGDAKILPTKESENTPDPLSPYALQKLTDEKFCELAGKLYGFDTVSLRYFNVFGPGQYGDSAYSTVISAWLTGLYFPKDKELFIEGTGKQSRDFCYVDNIVEANIRAMLSKKPLAGRAFNIADGKRISLIEIRKMIESASSKKLMLNKKPSRKGDVRHTHADIGTAMKWLGYTPKVDFAEGLQRTVSWFESRI